MLYNININQKAIIDNGWDLNLNELAVLSVIALFYNSDNCVKIRVKGLEYGWVSYSLIKDELPLLKDLSKDRIYRYVKKLESFGLVELCENNKTLSRTYVRLGANYAKLFSSNAGKKDDTIGKNNDAIGKNNEGASLNIPMYNNTNYNYTKISLSTEREKIKEPKEKNLNLSLKEEKEKKDTANYAPPTATPQTPTNAAENQEFSKFCVLFKCSDKHSYLNKLWKSLSKEEINIISTHLPKYLSSREPRYYGSPVDYIEKQKYYVEPIFMKEQKELL